MKDESERAGPPVCHAVKTCAFFFSFLSFGVYYKYVCVFYVHDDGITWYNKRKMGKRGGVVVDQVKWNWGVGRLKKLFMKKEYERDMRSKWYTRQHNRKKRREKQAYIFNKVVLIKDPSLIESSSLNSMLSARGCIHWIDSIKSEGDTSATFDRSIWWRNSLSI